MASTDEIVDRFMQPVDGESVSPNLRPLLGEFYASIIHTPTDLQRVKLATMNLLTFLTTSEGRTNANCVTVDHFVMIDDHWERDWSDLPDAYVDVIALMGEALHDTISAPEVAKNFNGTPEQILELAKQLPSY